MGNYFRALQGQAPHGFGEEPVKTYLDADTADGGIPDLETRIPGGEVKVLFKEKVDKLLGTCPSAAFYAHVYVYAMAINGISRQSQYDASSNIAFALTPKVP